MPKLHSPAAGVSDISNIGPHMPKIQHFSHIVLRLGKRCTCDVFIGHFGLVAAWTPTHGHNACSGGISYIDHVSMHDGRTSVGYWLMSEQRLVDFRSISIPQGLVLLWTLVDPRPNIGRFLTMCQEWLGDEVDRWRHRKFLIVVQSPTMLPEHEDHRYQPIQNGQNTSQVHRIPFRRTFWEDY